MYNSVYVCMYTYIYIYIHLICSIIIIIIITIIITINIYLIQSSCLLRPGAARRPLARATPAGRSRRRRPGTRLRYSSVCYVRLCRTMRNTIV